MSKENSYVITDEINISEENIEGIICTAIEGGIGYWGCVDNTKPEWKDKPTDMSVSKFITKLLISEKEVIIFDTEKYADELTDEDIWTLNLKEFLLGIRKYFESGESSCLYGICLDKGNVDACNIDADDADCIMQCALFGRFVFS